MANKQVHVVVANQASVPNEFSSFEVIKLNHEQGDWIKNVHIGLPDLILAFNHVPSRIKDLLELASYFLTADRLISRGRKDSVEFHAWSRHVLFCTRVRDITFWSNDATRKALQAALEYVTGDARIECFFEPMQDLPETLFDTRDLARTNDRNAAVLMFSGGLDSLSGAIHLLETTDKHLYLVSHQSQNKTAQVQDLLVAGLKALYPERIKEHVGFESNLVRPEKAREETQRSRSFLYNSVAFSLSQILGANSHYVFENGITSINLGKRSDMFHARASRTTHPKTLSLLQNFLSLVSNSKYLIINPYFWNTKSDVVEIIKNSPATHLIQRSVSCGRIRDGVLRHCGECSQCIDRKLACYAVGLEDHDDKADLYSFDFIKENTTKLEGIVNVVDYLRVAHKYGLQTVDEFIGDNLYELSELAEHCDEGDTFEASNKIHNLFRTQADQINAALRNIMAQNENPLGPAADGLLFQILKDKPFMSANISCLLFIDELEAIKSGKKECHNYEKLLTTILQFLFDPDLNEPKVQVSTHDKREVMDITFANNANSGFWQDIKIRHGNIVVVFEFKNMEKLTNVEMNQISSRLSDVKGNLGVIVCRKKNHSDFERAVRKLSLQHHAVLTLDDDDIKLMLRMKYIGMSPNEHISTVYRTLIEAL